VLRPDGTPPGVFDFLGTLIAVVFLFIFANLARLAVFRSNNSRRRC